MYKKLDSSVVVVVRKFIFVVVSDFVGNLETRS